MPKKPLPKNPLSRGNWKSWPSTPKQFEKWFSGTETHLQQWIMHCKSQELKAREKLDEFRKVPENKENEPAKEGNETAEEVNEPVGEIVQKEKEVQKDDKVERKKKEASLVDNLVKHCCAHHWARIASDKFIYYQDEWHRRVPETSERSPNVPSAKRKGTDANETEKRKKVKANKPAEGADNDANKPEAGTEEEDKNKSAAETASGAGVLEADKGFSGSMMKYYHTYYTPWEQRVVDVFNHHRVGDRLRMPPRLDPKTGHRYSEGPQYAPDERRQSHLAERFVTGEPVLDEEAFKEAKEKALREAAEREVARLKALEEGAQQGAPGKTAQEKPIEKTALQKAIEDELHHVITERGEPRPEISFDPNRARIIQEEMRKVSLQNDAETHGSRVEGEDDASVFSLSTDDDGSDSLNPIGSGDNDNASDRSSAPIRDQPPLQNEEMAAKESGDVVDDIFRQTYETLWQKYQAKTPPPSGQSEFRSGRLGPGGDGTRPTNTGVDLDPISSPGLVISSDSDSDTDSDGFCSEDFDDPDYGVPPGPYEGTINRECRQKPYNEQETMYPCAGSDSKVIAKFQFNQDIRNPDTNQVQNVREAFKKIPEHKDPDMVRFEENRNRKYKEDWEQELRKKAREGNQNNAPRRRRTPADWRITIDEGDMYVPVRRIPERNRPFKWILQSDGLTWVREDGEKFELLPALRYFRILDDKLSMTIFNHLLDIDLNNEDHKRRYNNWLLQKVRRDDKREEHLVTKNHWNKDEIEIIIEYINDWIRKNGLDRWRMSTDYMKRQKKLDASIHQFGERHYEAIADDLDRSVQSVRSQIMALMGRGVINLEARAEEMRTRVEDPEDDVPETERKPTAAINVDEATAEWEEQIEKNKENVQTKRKNNQGGKGTKIQDKKTTEEDENEMGEDPANLDSADGSEAEFD